jgi:hypothetical protein
VFAAQLIKLMDAYAALEYSRTLLEVLKLAYFPQEAGEPLRLNYEASASCDTDPAIACVRRAVAGYPNLCSGPP